MIGSQVLSSLGNDQRFEFSLKYAMIRDFSYEYSCHFISSRCWNHRSQDSPQAPQWLCRSDTHPVPIADYDAINPLLRLNNNASILSIRCDLISMLLVSFCDNSTIRIIASVNLETLLVRLDIEFDTRLGRWHCQYYDIWIFGTRITSSVENESIVISRASCSAIVDCAVDVGTDRGRGSEVERAAFPWSRLCHSGLQCRRSEHSEKRMACKEYRSRHFAQQCSPKPPSSSTRDWQAWLELESWTELRPVEMSIEEFHILRRVCRWHNS